MRFSHGLKKLMPVVFVAGLLPSCAVRKDPSMGAAAACDVSASIEPAALTSMVQALESAAANFHRGDSLMIIPITGDAETETSGRVLTFAFPTEREVYDEDIRRVNAGIQNALTSLAAQATKSPGGHTDIIGALRVSYQELIAIPAQQKAIVVLSDFIQDDGQLDFENDPRLAEKPTAEQLAMRLAQQQDYSLKNIPVFLGYIQSKDLGRLGFRRRQAIEAFWLKFLYQLGARPELVIDGPGLLPRFLAQVQDTGSVVPPNPKKEP